MNTHRVWSIGPLALCLVVAPSVLRGADSLRSSMVDMGYRNLAARADITYLAPAHRSEEGLPIGNGRTGSLVWTSPSTIRFQVNRVDVFACDATSVSFPGADSDYGSSCGYVDIHVADAGGAVFVGTQFRQHLSVANGLMTLRGNGITARIFALHGRDIIAVEIDDQRNAPPVINIDLRMLRYAIQCIYDRSYELASKHAVVIRTAEHTATSQLHILDGRILLTQEYREHLYYNATAVAIQVLGKPSRAQYLNESTVQLSVAPGRGKCTVLIASAATSAPEEDIAGRAARELEGVAGQTFEHLLQSNASWWDGFWSKGFVHMHSGDGQADFAEQHYAYFLYLMGSTSLGMYPPRFAGLLFNTTGDMRRWGSQYWWANTNAYYSNLMPANRMELMEPVFSMYSGMLESCAIAARQQWGSQGIWIPEIVTFKGLETLPDDIAAELQDLMLVRKPYEQRSNKFQWFVETKNRHHARWNFLADGRWDQGHYVVPTKASIQPQRFASPESVHGIFGHCTHILGAGARIAQLYWQRYQYTRDVAWLRDRAYPLIKGSAEFYRHFPNLKKEADGKYHIHHVNNGEGSWNSSDTPYEVTTMRAIFPLAVRASEVLGVDADLRPLWLEISENLVQVPDRPRRTGASRGGYGAFVYGGPGAIEPIGSEPELKSMFLNFNRTGGFIDSVGIGGAQIFRNRLRLREGPGAIDAEHIGGLTSGIHRSLLTSLDTARGGESVIKVFSAWPKEWDVVFDLLGHGGFRICSSQKEGQIEFVEVRSALDQGCRLNNPWDNREVTLYRNGKKAENLRGALLKFVCRKGESVVVLRPETTPRQFQRAVLQ